MYCLIYNRDHNGYLEFKNPSSVIQTSKINEVMECLSTVGKKVEDQKYGAGFITYEASPAFDEAFKTHKAGALPLLSFGVFDSVNPIQQEEIKGKDPFAAWQPTVQEDDYRICIQKIKNHIAEGDTYKVNYTFKTTSSFN